MAKPRPYIQKTIVELEEIFDKAQGDASQLRLLHAELDRRKTRRAANLRDQIQAILSGKAVDQTAPVKQTQQELWPEAENSPASRSLKKTGKKPKPSATFDRSYLSPPAAFTLVGPLGTPDRPTAYRPPLKNDLKLDLSSDSSNSTRFRICLGELIHEMTKRKIGSQQFVLKDGVRTTAGPIGHTYQFAFGEDANLFEGAKVELIIGGQRAYGQVVGVLSRQILLSLEDDYGPHIHQCVLKIDNTAILQALKSRMEAVENGQADGFRVAFADAALDNSGELCTPEAAPSWPFEQRPTLKQTEFVELALANELTWLWGPPGTGKTETLSALTLLLFNAGKRVLICSNTNRAVDQLLQKTCRRLRETQDGVLQNGEVIRLGRIENELHKEFGEFIEPDRVAERKGSELKRRKIALERELDRLGREVAYSQTILENFGKIDQLRSDYNAARVRLQQIRASVKRHRGSLNEASARSRDLRNELAARDQAGALRRMFARSEERIRRDINFNMAKESAAKSEIDLLKEEFDDLYQSAESTGARIASLEGMVAGQDRSHHETAVAACVEKQAPLQRELSEVVAAIEKIRDAVVRDARILGATVTRTFLRPADFSSFDVVIIDEASMILLPAIYLAVGLAREQAVIAGDFRQLPPILQTQQQILHDTLSPDIFARAGIDLESAEKTLRLVMLDEQFRMDESICNIVSQTFYQGKLRTGRALRSRELKLSPIADRLTIVDTSRVWPFTTRNAFESRLNLMHALAVRNLVLHLRDRKKLFNEDGECKIGIATPYAAQAGLYRDIFEAHSLDSATLRASTVHGFQGDEREIMVIDLVDSVGERNAGVFLQANSLSDSGAKLFNVALSRAKAGVIVVANLTFLDAKLPGDAILRGVLHEIQKLGSVMNVRDLIALHPISKDLTRFGKFPRISVESFKSGIFDGRDFTRSAYFDIDQAKESVIILSAFITPQRVGEIGDLLRKKVGEGVKVRCVTRPANRNGMIPQEQGESAIRALEGIGVGVDLRNNMHEKVILIDRRIVWMGSLNPLSHTDKTSEIMTRVDDVGMAKSLATVLCAVRRTHEDLANGAAAEPENPRCEECQGLSVLKKGRYGPYFECASGDGWTQSIDKVRKPTKPARR